MKTTFLILALICLTAPMLTLPGATSSTRTSFIYNETYTLDMLTVYNPTSSQCDHDPLVTASNRRICTQKLLAGEIRWMALSRDLLKRWGGKFHFGDTLFVQAGDPAVDGYWVIQDTMNKRCKNQGDLLFDAKTRSHGRWTNVTLSRKIVLTFGDSTHTTDNISAPL